MVELNWLLFCFLFLYVGQSLFNIWVERINLIHSQRRADKAPAGFEGFIDESKLVRTTRYVRAKTQVGIIDEIVSDVTLLAILLSGLLPLLVRWSDKLGLSMIAAGVLFFFVPGLIHFLVELAFSYYNTFVVEQEFGFNRSTLKLWTLDHIKGGLVTAALFAAIFSILLLFIAWSPRFWWFWGFLLLSAVQLVMAILYPVVLAPLFNRFEPVRDEELFAKISAQMEKSGIRVKKILQMNAGIRSRHTNAYFTGIGKTKQIVLFDTLIQSHTHEEILAVLAHEAGHFRKKHVLKQLLIFASLSLAAFYATWLFIQWPLVFSTFGFSAPLPYVGLFLAGVFSRKAGFFLQPLYMIISRRFEREADIFAAQMLGGGAALAGAMKRLAADNLSNLNPHPLYVWFHYSHPPIVERVALLEGSDGNPDSREAIFKGTDL
ncbi:MAG TPA: M48 family metallopeptidase [Deltaproteobacteria bacterium]|jgi:STE24 endopeptidase|nr:M48 family metallopeptidase [Deltaproteobacteria bacterium]